MEKVDKVQVLMSVMPKSKHEPRLGGYKLFNEKLAKSKSVKRVIDFQRGVI